MLFSITIHARLNSRRSLRVPPTDRNSSDHFYSITTRAFFTDIRRHRRVRVHHGDRVRQTRRGRPRRRRRSGGRGRPVRQLVHVAQRGPLRGHPGRAGRRATIRAVCAVRGRLALRRSSSSSSSALRGRTVRGHTVRGNPLRGRPVRGRPVRLLPLRCPRRPAGLPVRSRTYYDRGTNRHTSTVAYHFLFVKFISSKPHTTSYRANSPYRTLCLRVRK